MTIEQSGMKRKVLERFNWERTVDATEKLYRRVLDAKITLIDTPKITS